jgi:hypothetical protein
LTSWSTEVSLSEGNNTFTIIAKDSALNESTAVEINIFLDISAPTIPTVVDDGEYSTDNSQLHASWSSEDLETGVIEYQYAIGTSPNTTDVVDWTSVGTQTEITHSGLSLTHGQIYYILVKAKNGVGLWSEEGISDGIRINQHIPEILSIQPPDGSSGYAEGNINFSVNAQDKDGDGLLYQFYVDGEIIYPWQEIPAFSWTTLATDLGIHSVRIGVKDSNGAEIFKDIGICLFRKPPSPPLP